MLCVSFERETYVKYKCFHSNSSVPIFLSLSFTDHWVLLQVLADHPQLVVVQIWHPAAIPKLSQISFLEYPGP